jgi:hypothetical protein
MPVGGARIRTAGSWLVLVELAVLQRLATRQPESLERHLQAGFQRQEITVCHHRIDPLADRAIGEGGRRREHPVDPLQEGALGDGAEIADLIRFGLLM